MIKVIKSEDSFDVWIGMDAANLVDPRRERETFIIGCDGDQPKSIQEAIEFLNADLTELHRLRAELRWKDNVCVEEGCQEPKHTGSFCQKHSQIEERTIPY
jgi:hypothetical protein